MPKATINMRDGGTVTIEGTESEIVALLARLERDGPSPPLQGRQRTVGKSARAKATPMGLVAELLTEGFFREPKELGAIRAALKEKGHFYPATTLSPVMLRLVRKKELRRIKERKHWFYVG